MLVPTRCVEVVSGAFRVDNLAATLTFLQIDGVYQFGQGYAHGRLLDESPQQYMQEVAGLHAAEPSETGCSR